MQRLPHGKDPYQGFPVIPVHSRGETVVCLASVPFNVAAGEFTVNQPPDEGRKACVKKTALTLVAVFVSAWLVFEAGYWYRGDRYQTAPLAAVKVVKQVGWQVGRVEHPLLYVIGAIAVAYGCSAMRIVRAVKRSTAPAKQ